MLTVITWNDPCPAGCEVRSSESCDTSSCDMLQHVAARTCVCSWNNITVNSFKDWTFRMRCMKIVEMNVKVNGRVEATRASNCKAYCDIVPWLHGEPLKPIYWSRYAPNATTKRMSCHVHYSVGSSHMADPWDEKFRKKRVKSRIFRVKDAPIWLFLESLIVHLLRRNCVKRIAMMVNYSHPHRLSLFIIIFFYGIYWYLIPSNTHPT